jgi:hypothetical protein
MSRSVMEAPMKLPLATAPILATVSLVVAAGNVRAQVDDITISAPASADDVYPLAVIDRPGIVPARGALLTLSAAHASGHAQGSVGLVLGIARNWEVTGVFADDQASTREAEVGVGRLLYLAGPTEIDLRFTLPIHLEGGRIRDFWLGPVSSYTLSSRWVLSGFGNLFHIAFEEQASLVIPVEVGVGYQPLRRLHLYASAALGELGVYGSTSVWVSRQAPLDAGLIVALGEDWDVGLAASTTDVAGRNAEWTAGVFASLKSVLPRRAPVLFAGR